MDGTFVPSGEANVSVVTHALHYGTACFEGIRGYRTKDGPAVFRLKEHVNRLQKSMDALGLTVRFSRKTISQAVLALVRKNRLSDCYIRPVAFYGAGSLLDVYPKHHAHTIAIMAVPATRKRKTMNVMTSSFSRVPEHATKYGAKIAGFYANSIMAMHEARKKGYDEALLLDEDGNVAEGPAQNLFDIKGKELATPNSRSILPGITRDSVKELGKDVGLRFKEKKITVDHVLNADEVFYTGTLSEIMPILSVNKKKIGDGEIGTRCKILMNEFSLLAQGKNPKYRKWLTPV